MLPRPTLSSQAQPSSSTTTTKLLTKMQQHVWKKISFQSVFYYFKYS